MTFESILFSIDRLIINPLIFLMFGLALIVFLWGLVEFIVKSTSEEGRSKGKQHILWGIVGMFIMISAYGIIEVIVRTFHINDQDSIQKVRSR